MVAVTENYPSHPHTGYNAHAGHHTNESMMEQAKHPIETAERKYEEWKNQDSTMLSDEFGASKDSVGHSGTTTTGGSHTFTEELKHPIETAERKYEELKRGDVDMTSAEYGDSKDSVKQSHHGTSAFGLSSGSAGYDAGAKSAFGTQDTFNSASEDAAFTAPGTDDTIGQSAFGTEHHSGSGQSTDVGLGGATGGLGGAHTSGTHTTSGLDTSTSSQPFDEARSAQPTYSAGAVAHDQGFGSDNYDLETGKTREAGSLDTEAFTDAANGPHEHVSKGEAEQVKPTLIEKVKGAAVELAGAVTNNDSKKEEGAALRHGTHPDQIFDHQTKH